MNQSSIWIHSGWVNQSFFVWAEAKGQTNQAKSGFIYPFLYSPFELKLRLFQNDPISFYGTFLTLSRSIIHVPLVQREFQSYVGSTIIYQSADSWKTHFFPIEGISFTLEEFVQFLPLFRTWKTDFQLADDFNIWLRFMDDVYTLIEEGYFEPNQSGKWVLKVKEQWYINWASSIPMSSFSIATSQENQSMEQEEEEHYAQRKSIMEALIDCTIRELLQEEEVTVLYDEWKQSVEEPLQPLLSTLKTRTPMTTKENWSPHAIQDRLGVKQREPFKTAIVLNEPKENQVDWTLSLALIDRTNREQVIPVKQLLTGDHPWLTNPIPQLKKDLSQIQDDFHTLSAISLSAPTVTVTSEEAFELFMQHDRFEQIGVTLIVPNQLKQTPSIKVKLKDMQQDRYSGVDPILNWNSLSQFDYSIMVGSQEMSQEEFQTYVSEQKSLLHLNNQWLVWDPNLAERLKNFLDQIQDQYTYLDAWRLDQEEDGLEELDDIDLSIEWSEKVQEKLPQLYRREPALVPVPSTLQGSLRMYQQQGFSWLVHLRQIGFGGCLADDMGLGKSIQTIAYLLYILEQQQQKAEPFLLICPTSLLYNWEAECQKFAPELNVFIHHGNDRILEKDKRLSEYDLVITSYTLALRDERLLHEYNWNGLILDEAQHIKNKETKQRKAIRKLHATHRIALTGTPIENRLTELWSLMDLLNPSLLGNYKQFYATYIKPIEKDGDNERQQQLRTVIHPFLLRRTKETTDSELNLPAKHEELKHVPLTIEQVGLYQAIVNDIEDQIHSVSTMERRALILRTITRLKQICNHPAQFLKAPIEAHRSGKWETFQTLIHEIYERKESTLIFTQYKEMGKLIRSYLEETYGATSFLHGGLTKKQRLEAIETFQDREGPSFFVLSLKAGGVGLNLTKATNVIHYDRWWNPAVENQATDRAYRIGQTDEVHVYKLLTEGTIEEKIDRMITGKQHLADGILASSSQVTELSDEELLSLLRLS
ncbi:DEAD/DEAH box helicase [Shouchella sp. JSM 1781072]|uniref:DEAD/DEAH box helicase n=1 Tax=Shouchella sp. JSM 1781072 TaxID=3344581 RepID=UPI0035BFF91F